MAGDTPQLDPRRPPWEQGPNGKPYEGPWKPQNSGQFEPRDPRINYDGRKVGSRNRLTLLTNEQRKQLAIGGDMTALEFLQSVYRSEQEKMDVRLEAAKIAAPYESPKLANVTLKGDKDTPVRVDLIVELVGGTAPKVIEGQVIEQEALETK